MLEYIVAILDEAGEAGLLRPGRPRRLAATVLQAATTTAGRSAGGRQPITATEMWTSACTRSPRMRWRHGGPEFVVPGPALATENHILPTGESASLRGHLRYHASDGRPTDAEQRELEDAATRLVEKLGPSTVGDLDDLDRRARLDAALTQAGWRELRAAHRRSRRRPAWRRRSSLGLLARASVMWRSSAPSSRTTCSDGSGCRLRHGVGRTIAVTADLQRLASVSGVAVDAAGCGRAVLLGKGGTRSSRRNSRRTKEGVDLTRIVCPVGQDDGDHGRLDGDDLLAWEALAVTLTAADLVGVMEGTLALATDYAGSAASTACRSARSRPCSTCWPRPGRSPRVP